MKVVTQMKNSRTNELVNKCHVKIKIWLKRAITLVVLYGLYWIFAPLLGVKLDIYWNKMNRDINSTYENYYYTEIGGITYTKDKFYISLRKPYLFNVSYGYIYSSNNLITWQDEISSVHIPTAAYSLSDADKYYVESDGFTILISDNSDVTNRLLPRKVNNNCYLVSEYHGFISFNCNGVWQSYQFLTDNEKNLIKNTLVESHGTTMSDDKHLTGVKICKLYKQGILKEKLLESIYCAPKLSAVNINAYNVLHKIVQTNNLDILLDGSHTTYGDGKYVGIFYKSKQYYFIISTDGVHYEIKAAPSELVLSLAINLFN